MLSTKLRLFPDHRAVGCSQAKLTPPRKCTVWIMTDEELRKAGWDYNIVLRHEIGHCNGWRHDEDGKTIETDPQKPKNPQGWCVVDPSLWMCRASPPR
jgi:hypothetical protein